MSLPKGVSYNSDDNIWTLKTSEPERFEKCPVCKRYFKDIESKRLYCENMESCYCEECDPMHEVFARRTGEHTHFNIGRIEKP